MLREIRRRYSAWRSRRGEAGATQQKSREDARPATPAVTFRTAWRKADKELEQDAKTFWQSQKRLLPANVDPADRARELCAVAYRDNTVVGVSTATIEFVPQFRSYMAAYRCSVSSGFLTFPPLSWSITDYSRKVLEQWSLENPNEKVMGLMAILQAQAFVQRCPYIVGPANMVFTGFSPAGYPIRVAWFKHARIPIDWPPRPLAAREQPEPARLEPEGGVFHVPLDRFTRPPGGRNT